MNFSEIKNEIRNKTFGKSKLESVLCSTLRQIEELKDASDICNVFEIIGSNLREISISSLFYLTDEKKINLILKEHCFAQNDFSLPLEKIKKIKLSRLDKYKEAKKAKSAFFCEKRINQLKEILPELDKDLETVPETNSIISPLLLKGELIGFFEIFSARLNEKDIDVINDFSKKLIINIVNSILFNEVSEENKLYAKLFDKINSGVVVYEAINNGEDFLIKEFNRAAEKIERVKRSKVLNKKVSKVFPGVKEFGLLDIFKKVYKHEKPLHHPISIYKDKRIIGWRDNFVYKLPGNKIIAVYTDETQKMKSRKKLEESESKFRNLANSITDGAALIMDGKYAWANKSFCRIYGYTKKEIIGQGPEMLIPGEDHEMIRQRMRNRLKGGSEPSRYELKSIKKNGEEIIAEITAKVITVNGKKAILVTSRDITEKLNIQKQLQESEKQYRTIFDSSSAGILIADIETKNFLYANKAICKMLGFPKKELLNLAVDDIHPRKDLDHVMAEFESQARGEKVLAANIPCLTKNRKVIYCDISTTRTTINNKECNVGFFTEITERKIAETALAESEKKYKLLFDIALDSMVVLDARGYISFANKSFLEMSGYTRKDLKTLHISKIIYLDDYNRLVSLIKDCVNKKSTYKNQIFRALTKQRKIRIIELNLAPFTDSQGVNGIQSIIRDITERKKTEEEIRKLNEFNQRILDNAPVSIIAFDKEGKVTLANKYFYEMSGNKYYIGKNIYDSGFHKRHGLDIKYKDLLNKGLPFSEKNLLFHGKTKKEKFIDVIAVPLFNKKNRPEGGISISLDNTRVINAKNKLEKLNKNLKKEVIVRTKQLDDINKNLNQILDLKTKFTSDAAHEIRTPLTIIQGNLDLISKQIESNPDAQENIDLVKKEVKNITNILSDLTLLTKTELYPDQMDQDEVNINELLNSVYKSLKAVAEKNNTKLFYDKPKKDIIIKGDTIKLERLFLNIIRNGIKYSKNKGWVKIEVTKYNDDVKIIISDNGIGIPKNDLPYIFQRFYRVDKARSRSRGGTGLGLAISKWIAELHKGTIEAESRVNQGSRFIITLPHDFKHKKNEASLFNY